MKANFEPGLDRDPTKIPHPMANSPDLVELYTALMRFQIDDENTSLPFYVRLAQENGWQHEYARRVVFEYRRFLFLAVAAGHPVSPSDQVDQAWHLHLTYTRSYWGDLCQDLLGMPIHHTPSRGGPAEVRKFDNQYLRTIESYERLFGAPPVEDIWPGAGCGSEGNPKFQRISKRDNWVIRKPFIIRQTAGKDRTLQRLGWLILAVLATAGVLTSAHAATDRSEDLSDLISVLVIVIIAGVGFFLLHVWSSKCPECNKLLAVETTGQKQPRGNWKPDLEEHKCKYCGYTTWEEEPQCG